VVEEPKRRDLAIAFLVAGSLILFQVSFSRLISYKLFYHFVFFAISLSLLGLGAAGTYVAVRTEPRDGAASIGRWLAAAAVSVPIAFLLIANPFAITHHPPIRTKLLGADAIAYLLWCAPLMVWLNFCGGVVLTSLFSRFSERMGRLYASDLLGAGTGSLACVAIMKYASPPAAFVAGAGGFALALLAYGGALTERRDRTIAAGAVVAALGLSVLIFAGPAWLRNFENFRTETGKQRKILNYEWNHIIRTDHVQGWYVLDGEAATRIVPWTERERSAPARTPAYKVAPPNPTVAVIGVGGGRELAEALRANASSVLAIDINPSIIKWVRGRDRKLNNDLYFDPRVDLRLGEGRHVVRSTDRRFDVIVIHAIDTYAAAAAGAYALTENFLYTKEAFEDYWRSLSDHGVLTISRWLFYPPREDLRLFHTALAALSEMGVENPRDHLLMVAPVKDYRKLGDRRVWGYLAMSKRPLDTAVVEEVRAHVTKLGWSILYAPGMDTDTPFHELAHTKDPVGFQRGYPYLVTPVTDASPYLFQFYNPLHRTAYQASKDWATVNIYQWSAVTLLVALAACTLVSFATIVAPLLWVRRASRGSGRARAPLSPRAALYFAGLGLGYMAMEVPIIQVLSMYLGHPTYGFAVVLVALLMATGIGSLAIDRMEVRPARVCAIVAVLMVAVTLGVFQLLHATLDLPDPVRFALALGLVIACGLPMGMPLALGVRGLGRADSRSVAWAWGINGAASVVGSCLVMIAMVFLGSHAALAMAAGSYAVAAVCARRPFVA